MNGESIKKSLEPRGKLRRRMARRDREERRQRGGYACGSWRRATPDRGGSRPYIPSGGWIPLPKFVP